MVQEHTQASLIHEAVAIYTITPQTLAQIAESHQPDTVKVFNLLKSKAAYLAQADPSPPRTTSNASRHS
ncbi:MAG: hypothetical protein ACP5R2_14220 [Anaerolineae bacterium]